MTREPCALLALTAVLLAMAAFPGVARAQETPEQSTRAHEHQKTPDQPTAVHEHIAVAAPLLTPTREATGTSWLPDVAPMYGIHEPWRGWDLRLNGVIVAQAVFEPGFRHRTGGAATRQGDSVNWGMFMARRNLAGGRLGIRTMLSAEPWTVPDCGTLSFLATGEVCEGDTVHDRQEPHDLLNELAADYERPLTANWRWQVYGGLAGEPALGPPGYPHRASATTNPLAPITHHWLESTRVSFGVVTIGVHNQRWKTEFSAFNGREPDSSRVDVDLGAFDSAAARVSFLPSERLAFQVSAARLHEARSGFPFALDDPFTRVTTSAIYYRPSGPNGLWATTIAYGANHAHEIVAGRPLRTTTSAGLLESSFTRSGRHTVFGRGELAGMPGHHLHAHEYSAEVFTVSKLQVGYVRQFRSLAGLTPGIGGHVALSLLAPELAPRYEGRVARSFAVFFSLQAARHQM